MSFIPRHVFPPQPSLPRSYFLGHHKSGLARMKQLLTSIDLVIECRDYRVPLTSRNPLFEQALEGKDRILCYTKRDLGGGNRDSIEAIVKRWYEKGGGGGGGIHKVIFIRNGKPDEHEKSHSRKNSVAKVLDALRDHASQHWKLVGHRVMIVGMPNVGKSTLINALRAQGIGKGKFAQTGAQPGVTRKVSSGVKILESIDEDPNGIGGGVYLLDTPGVFIPHVPNADAMLKLALVGCVKDAIIPPILLADYLLYHMNLHSPTLYSDYASPTNDIMVLLSAIASKTGRLGKGGKIDAEATSLWLVQKWRQGLLGRFGLDLVDQESLERSVVGDMEGGKVVSMNQARRAETERRRARNRERGEK